MKTKVIKQTNRQDYFLNNLLELTDLMEKHTFTLHAEHPPDRQEITVQHQESTINIDFHGKYLVITGTNIRTMVFYREYPNWTYKSFNYGPLFISRFIRHFQCMNDKEYLFEPAIVRGDIIDALRLDEIDNENQTDEQIIRNIDYFIEDIENLINHTHKNVAKLNPSMIHERIPGLHPDMITHVINHHKKALEENDIYLNPHEPECTEPFHRAGYIVHPDIFYVHVLLTYIAANPERLIKTEH